jgi:hypothetical protein
MEDDPTRGAKTQFDDPAQPGGYSASDGDVRRKKVTRAGGFTMRTETPLWEKVYLGRWSKVYLNAGKVIGHLGCSAFAFFDAAKLLPDYDKLRYENAVRDLAVWEKRERGEYELHKTAKKVLRTILGPAPDDPEYRRWWELRLISVRQMREAGQEVEWAEALPALLEPQDAPEAPEKKPARPKKPAAKKARKK